MPSKAMRLIKIVRFAWINPLMSMTILCTKGFLAQICIQVNFALKKLIDLDDENHHGHWQINILLMQIILLLLRLY